MDATFLGLLDTNLEAIKKAKDNKSKNEKLLATAALLMDALDYSKDALSGYERQDITSLFSDFGKIARTACSFYQSNREILDSDKIKIRKTLEETTNELSGIIAEMEVFEQNNLDLLKKEKELNEKGDIYRKQQEKISSLKEINQALSEGALAFLENEISQLKETIDKSKNNKDQLVNIVKEFENLRHHNELDNLVSKAQDMYKNYSLNLAENSKIIQKMQEEYGFSYIENFIKETALHEKTIREELGKLDRIIGNMVDIQEKTKKEIEKKQGK